MVHKDDINRISKILKIKSACAIYGAILSYKMAISIHIKNLMKNGTPTTKFYEQINIYSLFSTISFFLLKRISYNLQKSHNLQKI